MVLLILFLGMTVKMNYLLNRVTGNYRLYVNVFRTVNLGLLLLGFGGIVLSFRFGRLFLAFFSLVISFFFFAFVFYFRYFGAITSWTDLGRADTLPPVISSVFKQIAKPMDLLFLLDVLFLFLVGFISLFVKYRPRRIRRFVYASLLILALLFQTAQSLAFNFRSRQSFEHVKLVGNSSFINCHGFTFYAFYDIYHHYNILRRSASIELRKPAPPPSHMETGRPAFRSYKNANVILLQVEALDSAVLFKSHNGLEITPNINRLALQNTLYDRYFAQHNTGTVDADYSLITSFYAGEHYTAFTFCDLSDFPSLPRTLKYYGYYTSAMHVNRATFYDRNRAFLELGFEDFFSQKDYPPPPDGDWALDDYAFLELSAKRILSFRKPFFTYLITISTHTPFDFHPREKDPPEFADIEPAIVKNYFCGMRFADSAVGRFMEILRQSDLMDNTIIVILGDHTSKLNEPGYSAMDYIEGSIDNIGEYPEHVPLVFIYPDPKSERISKPCYPGDVPPTIMEIVSVTEPPATEWMGHSLFSQVASPIINQGREVIFLEEGYLFRGRPENIRIWKKTVWGGSDPPNLSPEYIDYIFRLVSYSNDILLKNYR
jgi:phosphoglycerol transferase MdoB-like AlkP superfamily enzyme